VFGLSTDLCPPYPGEPWPEGFIDEAWREAVTEAFQDYERGVKAYEAQDFKNAAKAYEEALEKLAGSPFPLLEAYISQNLGVVYRHLGRYEEALERFEEARRVFVEHEMWVDVADVDVNMGVVYRHLGRYEEALGKYEEARRVYVAHKMWVDVADVDVNMGVVYDKLGRYEEALERFEEARRVFVEHEMWVDVAEVDVNMGNVYAQLGRYEEALERFEEARRVFVKYEMWVTVAHVDVNMGVVYDELGRYEEALGKYEEARRVYVEREMWVDVAEVDGNMGVVYAELGRYEEALERFEEARRVFVEHDIWVDVADVDMNMGVVYHSLGRYEEALERFEEARRVYVAHEMWVDVAGVDVNMGVVYDKLGRYEEALRQYEEARRVYVEREMWVKVADVDVNMGNVYAQLGRYEEALGKYEEALQIWDSIPPPPGMSYSYPAQRWILYKNRGLAYEALHQWEEALASYREALAVIESIRGYLKTEELKLAWGERTKNVYELLIGLLYRLGQGTSAFPYTERCRARTFLDILYQGGVKPEHFIGPKEGVVAGAVDPQAIDQAIQDALPLLTPHEAVLSYFVTKYGVYLWIVTKDGVSDPLFFPYPRENLMRDVLSARKDLERVEVGWEEGLVGFYEKLLAPGLARLPQGITTLLLIPSGPLWYVPWAALPMTDQPLLEFPNLDPMILVPVIRHPYLIEKYTLAYLPSLASLVALEERGERGEGFLGLANPTTVVEKGCVEAQRYVNLERATRAFARTYAGEKAKIYVAEEAKESRAYIQAAGHAVVVYACHGQFNPQAPLQSKLLLTPEEKPPGEGERRVPDGNYHAWEVLLTSHNGVELAVLAACETLLPAFRALQGTLAVLSGEACEKVELTPGQLEVITAGDEVVGLARAFLSTGARSVLATLWQASPYAVEELLVRMAQYQREGKSWVEALAQAQRDLLQIPQFTHPWFWAPYILIGRW